jgi:hypothetical protein
MYGVFTMKKRNSVHKNVKLYMFYIIYHAGTT